MSGIIFSGGYRREELRIVGSVSYEMPSGSVSITGVSCPILDVCIDERRLPLLIARATLREVIAGLEACATRGGAR